MSTVHWIIRSLVLLTSLITGTISVADDPATEGDLVVSYAMLDDPRIEFPSPVTILPPAIAELWIDSLDLPDAELQRDLAMAIEQAHRLEHADLSSAVTPLRQLLEESDAQLNVRAAAATALLTFNDRESAAAILRLSQSAGPFLAQVAEPALARWNYKPAVSLWLTRLDDPQVRRSELRLAVECLAIVNEPRAVSGLREIVLNTEQESTIRLAAARAWATIQRSGLEQTAQRLSADRSPQKMMERLIGACLLRYHEGPQAQNILREVAADPDPVVAAIAWERLLDIDSSLVVPLASTSLRNPDPRIRGYAVRTLDEQATIERLRMLTPLLSDPHPEIRNDVRRSFFRHAENPMFDQIVRDAAVNTLQSADWRGMEQAGMLLAALDHEAVAPQFLELLDHPRKEVALMAAWGLRLLAVPETFPPMLAYAEQVSRARFRPRPEFLQQCAHFFEAFGLAGYWEAEPLLRTFVSKNPPPIKDDDSRSAAIWALGHLYKGQPEPDLVQQFLERIQDEDFENPESYPVRRFSAISIGRMQAQSALPYLRQKSGNSQSSQGGIPPIDDVDYACQWAIQQITGEPMLEPVPRIDHSVNWFLVPIE